MQVECSDYELRHSDCNISSLLLKASLIVTGAVTQIALFSGEKTLQRKSEVVEFTKIIVTFGHDYLTHLFYLSF